MVSIPLFAKSWLGRSPAPTENRESGESEPDEAHGRGFGSCAAAPVVANVIHTDVVVGRGDCDTRDTLAEIRESDVIPSAARTGIRNVNRFATAVTESNRLSGKLDAG